MSVSEVPAASGNDVHAAAALHTGRVLAILTNGAVDGAIRYKAFHPAHGWPVEGRHRVVADPKGPLVVHPGSIFGRNLAEPLHRRDAVHVRAIVVGDDDRPAVACAVMARCSIAVEYLDSKFRCPPDAVSAISARLAKFSARPTMTLAASAPLGGGGHQVQALWQLKTPFTLTTEINRARLSLLLGDLAAAVGADPIGGHPLTDLWIQLPGTRLSVVPYEEVATCLEHAPERVYALEALEQACQGAA